VAAGASDTDVGRNRIRSGELHHCAAAGSGDQGKGTGSGSCGGLRRRVSRRGSASVTLPKEVCMAAVETVNSIPWWKEPTKDQWLAWVAAWLGWTLDAFDFTIFLFIMTPIAKEFNVPLTDVAIVFSLTLWMRLVGATASGWLADRMGRKKPLMISIAWYSACNFIAGFSPT